LDFPASTVLVWLDAMGSRVAMSPCSTLASHGAALPWKRGDRFAPLPKGGKKYANFGGLPLLRTQSQLNLSSGACYRLIPG